MALIRLDRFRAFLLGSAALVVVAVVASGLVVGQFFERQHMGAVAEQTALLVSNEARQHLTPEVFDDVAPGARGETFRRFLGELPGIFRIKVFDRAGRIVWSDEPKLLGRVFPDNAYLARALRGEVTIVLERPKRAEHVYERDRGWVAEAYVPIVFSDRAGVAGVIETYKDATATVADIRAAQTWIWVVTGGAGLALWAGFTLLAWRVSLVERRAIVRLESQNRELSAVGRFTQAILEPLDLERLAASVVECAGAGLGLRRAALYRVGADRELSLLAHWTGAAARSIAAPKEAPMEALTTRRPVLRGPTAAVPLFTARGGTYLFIGDFPAEISAADLVAVRVLEIMLQAASVALANVALFTEVREAHQQLAAILAGVTERMAIIDRRMRLVWTNAPQETGVVGQPCYAVVGAESCVECPGALAFLTGKVSRGRLAQRLPDGRVRHFDVVASPLADASGYVQRVLEVAHDITDLVEMEEELKRSSASLEAAHADLLGKNEDLERKNRALVELQGQLAEKERLAAVGEVTVGLHHAILNPLAGVAGALAVLRRGELDPAERERVFAEIDGALHKIEEVVRRLQTLRHAPGTPYVGATMMLDLEAPGGDPQRP